MRFWILDFGFWISKAPKLGRSFLFLLFASCLLLTAQAQSDGSQQNKTGRAGTFAITNARIVTV